MFNIDDDDQDFLSPSGGSKLASLFGVDSVVDDTGANDSLKYTAPKQPRKSIQPTDAGEGNTGAAPSLMAASAVHAYKYVDGSYASQGKVGAALIGNHANREYKLLLYYSKQQPLMQVRITHQFLFTVQKNRYVSLYDDERQGWSVMFEKDSDLELFAKQVCLARWLLASSAGTAAAAVLVQDVMLGEGQSVVMDDSVEVECAAHIIDNDQIGPKLDGNRASEKLLRFKLGRGKLNPAMDEGIVGMQKSGRKLVIIAPSNITSAQRSAHHVPVGAALLYDVTLLRVKFKEPGAVPDIETPPTTATDQSNAARSVTSRNESVKERSKSISEQLEQQSPEKDSGKAHLLSRMAKMGQAVMPAVRQLSNSNSNSAAAATVGDDDAASIVTSVSENEEPAQVADGGHIEPQPRVKPELPHRPHTLPAQAFQQPFVTYQQQHIHPMMPVMQQSVSQPLVQPMMAQPMLDPRGHQPMMMPGPHQAQQLALYQSPHLYQQPPNYPSLYQSPPPPPAPAPVTVSSASTNEGTLNVYFSEARQQSTELRLSLAKVTDKIDRVYEKVEKLDTRQTPTNQSYSSLPNMEAAMILQNLQRIIEENQTLKHQLLERGDKIQQQNAKITQLLSKNQSFVEESHVLVEERSEVYKSTAQQSQARQLMLEQDKVSLTTQLSGAMSQISDVTLELNELKRKNVTLSQQLSDYQLSRHDSSSELTRVKSMLNESEISLKDVSASLSDEKARRKLLESQLQTMRNDLEDVKGAKENVEKLLSDRKRKYDDDKRQNEQDLDQLKQQHEAELKRLQDRLRQQISSTTSSADTKASKLEEELNADWQRKYDRMMTSLQEKHVRANQELRDENEQYRMRVEQMTEKLLAMKAEFTSSLSEHQTLVDELDSYRAWPSKYEKLQSGVVTMRTELEQQITGLEEQRDQDLTKARAMKQRYEDRIRGLLDEQTDLLQQLTQLKLKLRSSGPDVTGDNSRQLADEVKRVMSQVYHELRNQLQAETTYRGAQVHTILLTTIKETTLRLVSGSSNVADSPAGGESESEGDESESEEEAEVEDTNNEPEKEEEQSSPVAVEGSVGALLTENVVETGHKSTGAPGQLVTDEVQQELDETSVTSSQYSELQGKFSAVNDVTRENERNVILETSTNEDVPGNDDVEPKKDDDVELDQTDDDVYEEAASQLTSDVEDDNVAADVKHSSKSFGDMSDVTKSEVDDVLAKVNETVDVNQGVIKPSNDVDDTDVNQRARTLADETVTRRLENDVPVQTVHSPVQTVHSPDTALSPPEPPVLTQQSGGELPLPPSSGALSSDAKSGADRVDDGRAPYNPHETSHREHSPVSVSVEPTRDVQNDAHVYDDISRGDNTTVHVEPDKKPALQAVIRVPPIDDYRDLFASADDDDPFGIIGADDFVTRKVGRKSPVKPPPKPSGAAKKKAEKIGDFDDDGRPQPPPPSLFGDDDSDADMDWLKS